MPHLFNSYPWGNSAYNLVNVSPNARLTYSAAGSFVPPPAANEVFYIQAPAAPLAYPAYKTNVLVHILRIQFAIVATAAAQAHVSIIKKSTLPTGGTKTDLTDVANDPYIYGATVYRNPQAVLSMYTAAPATAGTDIGVIKSFPYFVADNATGVPQIIDLDFTPYYPAKQGLVIQPVYNAGAAAYRSECVAISLNGGTFAGNVMHVNVEWTEIQAQEGTTYNGV